MGVLDAEYGDTNDLEKERLLDLVEYCRHSARLRVQPVADIRVHRSFLLFEGDISGLPGIELNIKEGGDEEIWLSVSRLRQTEPPQVRSSLLRPWIDPDRLRNPHGEPALLDSVLAEALPRDTAGASAVDDDEASLEEMVWLDDYPLAEQVQNDFKEYVEQKWQPWAEKERPRRKTIDLYTRLFTLKQELGGVVESPVELVWGVGMGVWKHNDLTTVTYPLLTQSVELQLDDQTAEIKVRPRDMAQVQVELDWYASADINGVADVEKAARGFLAHSTKPFSPFEKASFEPILRSAAAHLYGEYVTEKSQDEPSRSLPKPDQRLQITDTWVLFARPRSNNVVLQDLDRLTDHIEAADYLPPAVRAIVSEPSDHSTDPQLPEFRGVSTTYHDSKDNRSDKPRDLFFPKPYNTEQVRIVQLLEVSDGVVVQGPPGTGKTHTIANIISHYLAEGKRVLITSMKEPALSVLRDKIPEDIRALTVALLSSDREGIRQFEDSIHRIAGEIQSLDRGETERQIRSLEERIDTLHSNLAAIDRLTARWFRLNLSGIELEGERIDPFRAAREIACHDELANLIPDRIGIGPEFTPRFSNEDVIRLRKARQELGEDIVYVDVTLPRPECLPNPVEIAEVHRALVKLTESDRAIAQGNLPAMADLGPDASAEAKRVLAALDSVKDLQTELAQDGQEWTQRLEVRLMKGNDNSLALLEELHGQLEEIEADQAAFFRKPVSVPAGAEDSDDLYRAVSNLAAGKQLLGRLLVKPGTRRLLRSIRVLEKSPSDDPADWAHVKDFLEHGREIRRLVARWNQLSHMLSPEVVPPVPQQDPSAALRTWNTYRKVRRLVRLKSECEAFARRAFPNLAHRYYFRADQEALDILKKTIQRHLERARLMAAEEERQQWMTHVGDHPAPVIEELRDCLTARLGDPACSDTEVHERWKILIGEMERLIALQEEFVTVRDLCAKIAASGAPQYAELLKKPVNGPVDKLLPDNWDTAWRLRRLAVYLESIDGWDKLRELAVGRKRTEQELARRYEEVVAKRAWLRIAENASQRDRAALKAYLNAIKTIGKGTGKRAVRYRQEARRAAQQAYLVVPCWIMTHFRVSESLPAELGVFDLVIVDEASQSDLTALPALLRAKKVLIVGDEKQVSPDAVGIEEKKVQDLMARFLRGQVPIYAAQMSPERSIYDLYNVVFASTSIVLREHFRCAGPIIEYSKREFYDHQLIPLRIPHASERLDPPLVAISVQDGYRKGQVNEPEVRVIVNEIKSLVSDPDLGNRTIGVVSLLGQEQAHAVWSRLVEELGPELIERHQITCGDARTFQGNERDIMFLSMVADPDNATPLSGARFAQRFNVAGSRARDRMYLVRSVELGDLSNADELRRKLIEHFRSPYQQDEGRAASHQGSFQSDFEKDVYSELVQRGYRVTPQVRSGGYSIDLVVEGHNDRRLAVECDGDAFHGPERWADDIRRQRALERAGWTFWRCFASTFYRRRQEVVADLLSTLNELGIEPIGSEDAPPSIHTEHRTVNSTGGIIEPTEQADDNIQTPRVTMESEPVSSTEEGETGGIATPSESVIQLALGLKHPTNAAVASQSNKPRTSTPVSVSKDPLMATYRVYSGPSTLDPRSADSGLVQDALVEIIETEGPMLARRAYEIYVKHCGLQNLTRNVRSALNGAAFRAVQKGRIWSNDECKTGGLLMSVVGIKEAPFIKLRERGPRALKEIPPSEIQAMAHRIAAHYGLRFGSAQHLKAVLSCYELECTQHLRYALSEILRLDIPYVAEYTWSLEQTAAEQPRDIILDTPADSDDGTDKNRCEDTVNIDGLAVVKPGVSVFVEFIDKPGLLYTFTFTDGEENVSQGLISIETPFGRTLATALIDEVTEVEWNGEPKKVVVKDRQFPRYNRQRRHSSDDWRVK